MIRVLNFAFIAITGIVCLGLYNIAEQARVAAADLQATRAAIMRENGALTVLGAEWARVTQPGRIQALAQRHLDLTDLPAAQLSSLTQLPSKNPPLAPEDAIRSAKAVVPLTPPAPQPQTTPTPETLRNNAAPTFAVLHTGT